MSHPPNGTRLPAIKLALANPLVDVPSLLALASDTLDGAASIADDLDAQERIVAAAAVVGVLPRWTRAARRAGRVAGAPPTPVGFMADRPSMRHVRLGEEVDALLEDVARLHDGNTTNALRAAVRVLAELYRVPITAPTLALEGPTAALRAWHAAKGREDPDS